VSQLDGQALVELQVVEVVVRNLEGLSDFADPLGSASLDHPTGIGRVRRSNPEIAHRGVLPARGVQGIGKSRIHESAGKERKSDPTTQRSLCHPAHPGVRTQPPDPRPLPGRRDPPHPFAITPWLRIALSSVFFNVLLASQLAGEPLKELRMAAQRDPARRRPDSRPRRQLTGKKRGDLKNRCQKNIGNVDWESTLLSHKTRAK